MIFITGAARSGTSLTTGILKAHGLNLGPVNSLNENLTAREDVVKSYLRSIGADPLGQDPLPALNRLRPAPTFREDITRAVGQPEPWGYKCAKAVLFWPLWVEHFPEAKWVIVRRDADEIVDSCLRTGFMRAYRDRAGWNGWLIVHLARIRKLKESANCIEVWPREFIDDPEKFRPVAEFCGFEFDAEHVRRAVDLSRYLATQ